MKLNEELVKKIDALDEDKRYVLTMLLEDIEDSVAQTRIEERVRSEIREIIKESEQL